MTTITEVGPSNAVYEIAPTTGSSTSSGGLATSSLLPEPMCLSGNLVTQLAMLMTRCDLQDQINSTNVQDAADKASDQDEAARVQQMMDKADQDFGQALVTGIGDAIGGGLAIAGAVVPGGSTDAVGRGWAGVLSGAAKVAPGLGTITSAQFKANGDRDDAQATKYQAASDADVRMYNQAQSRAQAAAAAIATLEETLQGILQTQEATNLKAAGG